MPWIEVRGVPAWVPIHRLLDAGSWDDCEGVWIGERSLASALDIATRLRNLGMGGSAIEVTVRPRPKRRFIREARTREARRARDRTPGFTNSRARTDHEGRTFLTPEPLAYRLGQRAQGQTVLDVTAGCGGNAIGFARAGCNVTAVDTDAARLKLAAHNASVYGVSDRIQFIHTDALSAIQHTDAELVFADPPWGEVDRVRCEWIPLLDEITDAWKGALWLKVPPSFVGRPGFTPEAWFGDRPGDRQRVKFVLLCRDAPTESGR